MDEPLVSIVLPTHNGSRFIEQALSALVAQTMPAWELIVVDDASTDDTCVKVAAWQNKEPRIRLVRKQPQRGLPGALNDGFALARGKYFSTTSDDNWHAADALERLTNYLQEHPSVTLVYAGYSLVNEAGEPLGQQPALPVELLPGRNVVGACFLFRRELFEQLGGFDESLFLVEDYDFWLRASLEHELQPLQETFYFYRVHPESLSATKRKEISAALLRCLTNWKPTARSLTAQQTADFHWQLAAAALDVGDLAAARRHWAAGWRSSFTRAFSRDVFRLALFGFLGPGLGNFVWQTVRTIAWPVRCFIRLFRR